MTPDDRFHSSASWQDLLPADKKRHIWIVTKNVTLTLSLPDHTARTFQEHTCVALKMRADSLVLTEDVPSG